MDIEAFLDEVRDKLLTYGMVLPTIRLELSSFIEFISLDILNDHQSILTQSHVLSCFAREHCKQYQGEKPVSIAFFSQAWLTHPSDPIDDALNSAHPISGKRGKDVLVAELWQAGIYPPMQSYVMDIIRNPSQEVVSIHSPLAPSNRISYQLSAFLHGTIEVLCPGTDLYPKE